VTVKQAAWESLSPAVALHLAQDLLDELTVTRLDLAGDDHSVGRASPEDLYALAPRARTRVHRRNIALTVDLGGGAKLTVGARSSALYLRVYVKGDRTRHELELKGAAALRAVTMFGASASWGAIWADEYARLVRWPSH
jgi:DNA relaxase NicK